MPYQIVEFDGVPLPIYNPTQDHSPVGALSPYQNGVGGLFDAFSEDGAARPQLSIISISGVVWGQTEYIVDEDGDFIVDESGDEIIAGTGPTMLRSQLSALRSKVRKRGKLWRVRLDDGVREWKTAYFVRMSQPQTVSDRLFKAHVTCEFESDMMYWHAESLTSVSGNATNGSPLMFVVYNPAETITDALARITATSGTITSVTLACDALGIGWTWTGTLSNGETLVVDAGNQGVEEGGIPAYSGFSLTGSSKGFMTIEPGAWVFEVLILGGTALVELEYYHQFA